MSFVLFFLLSLLLYFACSGGACVVPTSACLILTRKGPYFEGP